MASRRDFIKQAGMLATAGILLPQLSQALLSPESGFDRAVQRHVGLQLYTLRDIIGNNITGIIEQVAAIGYKEVETYDYSVKNGFWGLKPKDFASLLKQNGLKAPSGHFDIDTYLVGKDDRSLKSCVEAANITGGKYITIPFLQSRLYKTPDDLKRTAQKFNEAGEICKAAGLKLAYHNHEFEFKKVGDTTIYETLLRETDKNLVDFEMDLFWVKYSGTDPVALFKAYPKRFAMWHVKDMDKQNKNINTEVGQGAIDFKAIFAAAKQAGVKHYFVEHETNYKPDEMGSIKTSFEYIKKELL